ncbi:MAG: HsdM family class I SAM-dependent methyltransferase [Egibacteraceae bacterium]
MLNPAGADTPALRKARGAFFTPPAVADFITRWAIRTPADRILEPACGEASFLLSAARRLSQLGASTVRGDQLQGVELHQPSALRAQALLATTGTEATIHVGDFFETSLARYDVVIGNPPYLRYQEFTGDARWAARQAAGQQDVRLSGLASSWAAFVVHAADRLAPGGRMGLVLPAELMSVSYAADVRRFLLRRFGHVRLVTFERLVFPDALEDVVLLLAEGQGPTDHLAVYQAGSAADLAGNGNHVWVRSLASEAKWTSALLDGDAFGIYGRLTSDEAFCRLADWGRTYLGAVTGNNRWFTLTGQEVAELGLPQAELRRISPPGSRHLRGLAFSSHDWATLREEGCRAYLFFPARAPSAAARRRIEQGERQGIPQAYKCRVRDPWWRVPLVAVPDLLLTYMNHDTPRLTANCAQVRHLNSVHGVALHERHRHLGYDVLAMAALNSVTLLGAEMVGRAYGGGMLKVEPREADQLPLPAPSLVQAADGALRALHPRLAQALREGELLEAVRLVDRVLLQGGVASDGDVEALRAGRQALFQRRVARARSRRTVQE